MDNTENKVSSKEKVSNKEIEKLKITNNILATKAAEYKVLYEETQQKVEKLEKMLKLMKEQVGLINELEVDSEKKLEYFLNRQKRIFENKVNHGFNTTNVYQEARYILEETAELMRAIEKNDRENMIEELADIVIFAYGCTEVARLGNLDKKIFEKMALNEKRVYTQTEEGDFIKTE